MAIESALDSTATNELSLADKSRQLSSKYTAMYGAKATASPTPLDQLDNQAPAAAVDASAQATKPNEKQRVFDAQSFMKDAGFKLIGSTDNAGQVRVVGPDGKEGTLDLNGLLKEVGAEGARVDINDPRSALPTSPSDWMERAALSFGDKKGNMAYLKSRYEDVNLSADGDFTVKKNGVWHQVDPENLGDGQGWDIAGDMADFAKDALIEAGEFVGTTAGAGLGALAGGIGAGPGALAGRVAGAALASSASVALGRFIGTYGGDGEDIAKDIAWDSTLALGGELIPIGMRESILPGLAKAGRKIADSASPAVKDLIAYNNGVAMGISKRNADLLFENPEQLVGDIDRIRGYLNRTAKNGAIDKNIDEYVGQQVNKSVKSILDSAQSGASREYLKGRSEIAELIPANAKIDIRNEFFGLQQSMIEQGWIKPRNVTGSDGAIRTLMQTPPIDQVMRDFKVTKPVAAGLQRKISELNNLTQNFRDSSFADGVGGVVTGKEGAESVMEYIKKFNNLTSDIFSNLPDTAAFARDQIDTKLNQFSLNLFNKISPEAGKKMLEVNKKYAMAAKEVAWAKKFDNPTSLNGFITRLAKDSGQDIAEMQNYKNIVGRMGKKGEALDSYTRRIAGAGEWARNSPKGLIQMNPFAQGIPLVSGLVRRGQSYLSSPNLVARASRQEMRARNAMAAKGSSMLKRVDDATKSQVLQDPKWLGSLFSETLRLSTEEDGI